MTHRVFVYGTLLQGEPNHHVLERGGARCLGAAALPARFEMRDLGPFPAVVDDGGDRVQGEVYEVDDAGLAALDRLESHPVFYRRRQVRLAAGRGTAWVYVMPRSRAHGPRVASGDWRRAAEAA